MRIEIINGQRVEYADEGNWLYNELSETERYFTDSVYLGKDAEPWKEVTDAEYVTWGMDFSKSIDLSGWNPTNNLRQFLQNFRTYIALRLADNGSGLTLTLSQAVRNAIHAAEATCGIENIIITQKGWTISPAPN